MSRAVGWPELEAAISGSVILPGSPAFDGASRARNARFDHVRPQAVVRCGNSEDVAEAIRFAHRHGMAVGTRGGGHCFGGRSSTDGLLIDVTPIRSAEVSDGRVTVGGGTSLREVYDALLDEGVAIPGGSCPSVGVAGLTLGGGLGIIGRKHGLTSDHLLGAEIVVAGGQVLECDDEHDEDLFWALRGGGPGNLGVVTELTLGIVPAPDATNFHLAWPVSRAPAVIEAWMSWSPAAPDELAASLVIGAGADIDEPPSVEVFGVMLGSESDAEGLIDPFVNRTGADPVSAARHHTSFRETVRYWAERATRAGDAPGQELRGARYIRSEFFDHPLTGEAIEGLLATFLDGRVAGQSRELDFSPWGGAYNRVPADATAFVHRDHRYWLKHAAEVGPDASPSERDAAHDWAIRSWETVHALGTGGVFPNFPDPDLTDWASAYYGANLDRLLQVKARYDPDNLFRFQQSLPVR